MSDPRAMSSVWHVNLSCGCIWDKHWKYTCILCSASMDFSASWSCLVVLFRLHSSSVYLNDQLLCSYLTVNTRVVGVVMILLGELKHTECCVGLDQLWRCSVARCAWSCSRETVSSVHWWYSRGIIHDFFSANSIDAISCSVYTVLHKKHPLCLLIISLLNCGQFW